MEKADLVLINGKIHTMAENKPEAECIAVKDGRILSIGSDCEIRDYIQEDTEILDAAGRVVLPGLIEPHVHAPGNAYNVLYNINLFHARSEEETMDTIRDFVEQNPFREIYYGRGFTAAVFPAPENSKGPMKERLDAICPDKPMIIIDFSGHMFWLNSRAMEQFQITEDTLPPAGGIIEKDDTGALWGILKEEAKLLIPDQEFTHEEKVGALEWFQNLFLSYGYTSILSMRPSACSWPNPLFEAAETLRSMDKLHLRFFGAKEIKPQLEIEPQIEELVAFKKKFSNELIHPITAKFFVDGTVEGVSAWLSEPYLEPAGKGDSFCGAPIWEQERLEKACEMVLKAGFSIHVHAIGDMAVTKTIDALERAQNLVPGNHRNVITHLQVVQPEDIKRMKRLGIIACTNVYWHYKDPCAWFEAELPFLGKERAEQEYPLAGFVRQGVRITCSADHPITPDPNPFHAIQIGMTRNSHENPDDSTGILNPKETVSLMDMLKAYTVNSAYSLFAENEIGSLEAGKYADFIVVNQDIFSVPAGQIGETKIDYTVFNGKVLYKA